MSKIKIPLKTVLGKSIRPFNPASLSKDKSKGLTFLLNISLVIFLFAMPVSHRLDLAATKFGISAILIMEGFKWNWSKLFYHKMSKKGLIIPHYLVEAIPTLIWAFIAYGVLAHHAIGIYITIGALAIFYALLTIPLYIRLKQRGDAYTFLYRNIYNIITSFIMMVALFPIAGYFTLGYRFGYPFFTSYLSNLIVAPTVILLVWTSHIRYFYLTKAMIWIFVKDEAKREKTLLNL